MSLTLIVRSVRAPDPLLLAAADGDPRIECVVRVSGDAEMLEVANLSDRFCVIFDVDTAEPDALTGLDRILELEPDATVIVAIPASHHALGLEAIRRGAQDYVERDEDNLIDTVTLLQRLNNAIERGSRIIRTSREHRRMAKVLEHSAEGYVVVDPSGAVLTSSPSLERIWPDGFDHLSTIFDALHPDDRELARALGASAREHPGQPAVGEVRAIDRHGDEHWFEIRINDQSHDPAIAGLITNVRDVTDRVRSDQQRGRAEERFRLGFENAAAGLTLSHLNGQLIEVNEAMSDILGRQPSELVGHDIEEFLHPESPPMRPLIDRLIARQVESVRVERRFVRPDSTVAWVLATTVLIPAGEAEEPFLRSEFQNVTATKESERALAHQAMHDTLTGLPNRVLLEQRLNDALAGDEHPPTVLFVDLDNFKVVNDGLGHTVGDTILIEIATRLRNGVRADDTAARFGGDEFALVLRGLTSHQAALSRAEHLLEILSEPVVTDGLTHFVSASIGVALGGTGATAETVLRDADAAMNQAKALGRQRVVLFEESFHSRAEHRLRTGTKMRHGLDAGHFHVAYQPFIAVDDERVIGMEALLRWDDPESGRINPAEFIPVAEQTGLIVQLGAWALDEALRQLQVWQQEQPWGSSLSLSVNLSARQLAVDGLIDTVHQSIVSNGVDAGALCLEITETAVMSDIETSIGLMRMMRSLGVDLSIDDFGTGYSSLNYLKSLPLTTLKIDRSFIDGLGNDPHDTSIVEAVVALGHALGMRVHAEGVERRDQLVELQRIGCDDAQGWLWAPAMPANEFEVWMNDRGR